MTMATPRATRLRAARSARAARPTRAPAKNSAPSTASTIPPVAPVPFDTPFRIFVGTTRRTVQHLRELAGKTRGSRARWLRRRAPAIVLEPRAAGQLASSERTACESWLSREGIPRLGSTERLGEILASHAVTEVVVTLPLGTYFDEVRGIIRLCETSGVPVAVSSELFESELAPPELKRDAESGLAALQVSPATRSTATRLMKRTIDIIGALVVLTIASIPMLIIAMAIKASSKGPVFFVQERCGYLRRPFRMFKFRTMVADAEARRQALEGQNELDGPVFKMRKDPRVTRIGSVLRKLSLDELPQLFNVLRGDMSLVGPRPAIPKEVEAYEPWMRRRLSVKPGLTCTWQVSGRNEIGFQEWMRLDLEYVDRWSIGLDLSLLAKTIPAVVSARGAC
jgi:exopolysaccharide biosynthesis polyprenyl glycosylphosphotransferase